MGADQGKQDVRTWLGKRLRAVLKAIDTGGPSVSEDSTIVGIVVPSNPLLSEQNTANLHRKAFSLSGLTLLNSNAPAFKGTRGHHPTNQGMRTPLSPYLSETTLASRRYTSGQTFCSTASPTVRHLSPPGPATSDALCKPGNTGAGTADAGSVVMAEGSLVATRPGRSRTEEPSLCLVPEPSGTRGVEAAAAAGAAATTMAWAVVFDATDDSIVAVLPVAVMSEGPCAAVVVAGVVPPAVAVDPGRSDGPRQLWVCEKASGETPARSDASISVV